MIFIFCGLFRCRFANSCVLARGARHTAHTINGKRQKTSSRNKRNPIGISQPNENWIFFPLFFFVFVIQDLYDGGGGGW